MSEDYTLSFAVPESIRQQLLGADGRQRREGARAEVIPDSWEDAADAGEAEPAETRHAVATTQPASALGEDLAATYRARDSPSNLEVVLYAVDATALLGESRACSVRRRLEAARALEAAIEKDSSTLTQLLNDGHAHPTTSATAEEDVVCLCEQAPQSLFLLVAGPDRIHGVPSAAVWRRVVGRAREGEPALRAAHTVVAHTSRPLAWRAAVSSHVTRLAAQSDQAWREAIGSGAPAWLSACTVALADTARRLERAGAQSGAAGDDSEGNDGGGDDRERLAKQCRACLAASEAVLRRVRYSEGEHVPRPQMLRSLRARHAGLAEALEGAGETVPPPLRGAPPWMDSAWPALAGDGSSFCAMDRILASALASLNLDLAGVRRALVDAGIVDDSFEAAESTWFSEAAEQERLASERAAAAVAAAPAKDRSGGADAGQVSLGRPRSKLRKAGNAGEASAETDIAAWRKADADIAQAWRQYSVRRQVAVHERLRGMLDEWCTADAVQQQN